MSPAQAGRGRPAPDLDPHRGPLVALAWALFVLRPPRGRDGYRTLEEIGRLINYDKSSVSRLTNGRELPSPEPMKAYLKLHGVADTEPWERLRGLAEKAGEGTDELRRVAEAFVELCATSLPEQFAAQQVGTAQDLLASWTPPADFTEEEEEDDDVEAVRPRRVTRLWWTAGVAAGLVVVVVVTATVVSLRANGDDAAARVPGARVSASGVPASPDSALAACGRPTAQLRIASSTDKSAILREIARLYGPRTSHGGCVTVVVDSVDSGIAMQALARGGIPRPTARARTYGHPPRRCGCGSPVGGPPGRTP